jgi:hypothetical protein
MIVFLSLFLVSCESTYNKNDIIQEFSEYERVNHVAFILSDTIIYYKDFAIFLNDIDGIKGEPSNGIIIDSNDNIYFTCCEEVGLFDFSNYIYQYNVISKHIEELYSQKNYTTHVWGTAYGDDLYFGYNSRNAFYPETEIVDKYNIKTNEYTNVSIGQGNENDYVASIKSLKYSSSITKDELTITENGTNKSFLINNEVLKNSSSGKSLLKFESSIEKCYIFDDDIYVIYRIDDHQLLNKEYPFTILKYNMEENNLIFQNLIFASDCDDYMLKKVQEPIL